MTYQRYVISIPNQQKIITQTNKDEKEYEKVNPREQNISVADTTH